MSGKIGRMVLTAWVAAALMGGTLAGEETVLVDFETPDALRMLEGRANIELVAEHASQGKTSGKVNPGFVVVLARWTRMPTDWSGWDELRLDVFNPGDAAGGSMWISDAEGNDYWKRHNSAFTLRPGANTLVIPVGGLYRGEKGSGQFLDPKTITQVTISLPKTAEAYYIDNIRFVKGAGKVETQLLIGFEEGEQAKARWNIEDWPPDRPGRSTTEFVADHVTEGARALKYDYRANGSALVIHSVPPDWSGYDTLEIDCFNTSDETQRLSGWFRDAEADKSGGYWDRHNYSKNLPPGKSTLRFPVGGLYRGEKGSGKFLDTKAMVSLCLGMRGVTVYFDNVRLVKGTEEIAVAGLRKFDFGPTTSPNFPGFTAVHPETVYDAQRGYGWVDGRPGDARNYEQPDSLLCDFIRLDGHRFAVDVPNGEYTVHVNLDGPGMWDYMSFQSRAIEAEGREVFRQTLSSEAFLRDWYFRYENEEDLPGKDIWKVYVGERFVPKTFKVTVADGRLDLRFTGDTWGLTLGYIVIYPAAEETAGKQWMDQMNDRRKQSFCTNYAEVVPTGDPKPAGVAGAAPGGFILFSRPIDREVTFNSAPTAGDTRTPKIDWAACPGEYESFSFSVYPLKDCGDLTLKIGDLTGPGGARIPASAFQRRVIRYKFKRIGSRVFSSYTYKPHILVPFDTWPIAKDVTRRFWLTLKVPDDATPGKYTGKVEVSLAGTTHVIPAALEVYPFKLDEPAMPIGMFGGSRPSYCGYWDEDLKQAFGVWKRTEEVIVDQKAHGMTAVTPIAPGFRGFQDGKAVFDTTDADRFMELLRKHGFHHECFTYAGMFRVREGDLEADTQRQYGMSLENAIKLAYEGLGAHIKRANWPVKMAWALADEPLIHAISAETVIKVFKAHRAAAPQMQFVIEDAMGNPDHYVVIPACDIICGNSPRYAVARAVKEHKSRYWFNNIGTDRFVFGWFLWKAKEEMGVEALFQWGYSTNKADIYYDFDGSEPDSGCSFTTSKGQRAMRHWELIREGADDHRYLQTLANLIAKARKTGTPAQKAEAAGAAATIRMVMSKVNLENKRERPYTQADLETFKRTLAKHIMALR
ncbi:MAG TPA: hypothetical protein VMZ92_07440 [Planctomycetota bacterium]|nr:hypothetical protein [Planctomycetota bacterium]